VWLLVTSWKTKKLSQANNTDIHNLNEYVDQKFNAFDNNCQEIENRLTDKITNMDVNLYNYINKISSELDSKIDSRVDKLEHSVNCAQGYIYDAIKKINGKIENENQETVK
jgi:hypothetical protein